MHVLIVDDTKSMRLISATFVEELGHKATMAENGDIALELFKKEKFDLVLMDVEMPGLDGFDVTRMMRKIIGPNDWIPIIFLSTHFNNEYFVTGIEAGGDAYLAKPLNPPVLKAMVKAMGRIADVQHELHKANIEMEKLVNVDVLTMAVNRRGFDSAYEKEWRRTQRDKKPLSLLLIDVDHFKIYNDHYGHIKGDECLRKVATAIKNAILRPADLVARYGGEEFAIILPDTDSEGAMVVAERVRSTVATANIEHSESLTAETVTISVGVSERKANDTPKTLLESADNALYKAKKAGRNQVFGETTAPENAAKSA